MTVARGPATWLMVALLSALGCRSVPASLLLTLVNAPEAAAPDQIRLQVFDRHGQAHEIAAFAAPAAAAGGQLGTVVVYPRPGGSLSLRLQAQGLQGETVVSEGALTVELAAGSQRQAEVVLAGGGSLDQDGDGVADGIDNCAGAANPAQEDADGDGLGDGCTAVDGGPLDGAGPDRFEPSDGLLGPGAPCSGSQRCQSGFCVEGVCCDSPCAGACRACNLVGALGLCQDIPANGNPRASGCPAEPASSCGRTGRCDGAGGCQLQRTGTPCGPGSCTADVETPPPTCNGAGLCVEAGPRSCGSYRCQADSCHTRCGGDGDCAEGAFCFNELCAPRKANGADCSAGNQCTSGFCADGVCCDSACTETCRTCNGSVAGTCELLTSGRDMSSTPPCNPPSRCIEGGICL
jgi:hypothetical protein